jgi:hypothetical protein
MHVPQKPRGIELQGHAVKKRLVAIAAPAFYNRPVGRHTVCDIAGWTENVEHIWQSANSFE